MLKNPVMIFMVLAIVFSGAGAICTSLAALFHHPPTAEAPAIPTVSNPADRP